MDKRLEFFDKGWELFNMDTSIGKVKLNGCIMNASGVHCTLKAELLELEESDSAAIVSKSCTLYPRTGNDNPRLYLNELGSLNSMGLPNLGHEFYKEQTFSKPYILSVANINEEDTFKILDDIPMDGNINLIELNTSCPNIRPSTNDTFKSGFKTVSDDFLRRLYEKYDLSFGLKLPPCFYGFQFEDATDIIKKYPIRFVTCINSIPNSLIINSGKQESVIKPNNGLGGLGGDYIKPIGLANVYNFRKLLSDNIDIIGCGGISSGDDVFEYILAGASAVQVGTALLREGPKIFKNLNDQLRCKMEQQGYHSISSFKNSLNK